MQPEIVSSKKCPACGKRSLISLREKERQRCGICWRKEHGVEGEDRR